MNSVNSIDMPIKYLMGYVLFALRRILRIPFFYEKGR
jgi:hypothetical protein